MSPFEHEWLGVAIGYGFLAIVPIFGGWNAYLTKQIDNLKRDGNRHAIQLATIEVKLDAATDLLHEIRDELKETR
jgi:hypothetical protein